ncbi:hypothetical protein [Oceanobacillus kapialis]|uniref:Uncharacterized protein n=1 Tax=Oceanobacillus kapialis TaxID=481353 RepID=A0ABW5Q5E6_9BACI
MDISSILEAIFGNMFVILAIIAGIIGFFKEGSKKKEENTQNRPRQNTPPTQRSNSSNPRTSPSLEDTVSTIDASSIEEQQQNQLDHLANRYATAKRSAENISENLQRSSSLKERSKEDDHLSASQKQFKRKLNRNLTKQGLANGVIMAEILGPPRAKKPYRTVVQERK